MTKQQLMEIENDNTWVRITYLTYHSQGCIIMKSKFYELKMKKIEKELYKTTYYVDYNYQLSIAELIMMDKEHQAIQREIKRLKRYLDYELNHRSYADNMNYIHKLEAEINDYKIKLSEIETQIVEGRRIPT